MTFALLLCVLVAIWTVFITRRLSNDSIAITSNRDSRSAKTYVAEFLREFLQWRAAPRWQAHSINNTCAVNRVWAIDLAEHRIEPQRLQPLLGILDHGSRLMLAFRALRDRWPITILRLLLDAIEHYGQPKSISTWNEAIFAFTLQWEVSALFQWSRILFKATLQKSPARHFLRQN